jgi:hypothetical protein
MPADKFNKSASPKINDYFITLGVTELDPINQQVRPFEFKRAVGDWVAQQTGVVPSIEVDKSSLDSGSPRLLIQCTEKLMDDIKAQFATDIVDVERLRKFSEIPPSERGCWKPHHGR